MKKSFQRTFQSKKFFHQSNLRFARKNFSNQKKLFCNQNVRREPGIGEKVFSNQKVLFESAAEPDSGSDLHIVRAVFGTPFWPKSSRNDRFYTGLTPKRGWNLGPAGRPPAGQPGPAKKSFLDSRLIQNTFFDSKHFFRSTLF